MANDSDGQHLHLALYCISHPSDHNINGTSSVLVSVTWPCVKHYNYAHGSINNSGILLQIQLEPIILSHTWGWMLCKGHHYFYLIQTFWKHQAECLAHGIPIINIFITAVDRFKKQLRENKWITGSDYRKLPQVRARARTRTQTRIDLLWLELVTPSRWLSPQYGCTVHCGQRQRLHLVVGCKARHCGIFSLF